MFYLESFTGLIIFYFAYCNQGVGKLIGCDRNTSDMNIMEMNIDWIMYTEARKWMDELLGYMYVLSVERLGSGSGLSFSLWKYWTSIGIVKHIYVI